MTVKDPEIQVGHALKVASAHEQRSLAGVRVIVVAASAGEGSLDRHARRGDPTGQRVREPCRAPQEPSARRGRFRSFLRSSGLLNGDEGEVGETSLPEWGTLAAMV
ncbi:hypothetical protein AAFF_G00274960 [Aldrovandia affinis]|uniref:Uncharacterized protein n=1 Tax=Aldrovandia affinis TaxID=143900 RepID=A0AAD7WTE7_9TELE|nr:hypothetical protein AAFF_G00274960 [Aldrovandia affinis]